jgi:beta-mannosidase
MAYETGEPTTLEEYVDFTMACQAEGLKVGVEHYRRRQPHCSGTLVWQLNDSWPGLSWSVLDYDLVPKASYYFLQRAYQPLLASFALDGDRLELWVTHSGTAPVELDLTVEVGDTRFALQVTAEPFSSAAVWSGTVPAGAKVAWVSEAKGLLPSNRRFLGRVQDVVGAAKVTATLLASSDGRATVELRAEGDAYLVRVMSDRPGARFSTNYVDVRDGQTCVVEVTGLPPDAQLSVGQYGGPTQFLT